MFSRLMRFLLIIAFLLPNFSSPVVKPANAQTSTCGNVWTASPSIGTWTPATTPTSISIGLTMGGLIPGNTYYLFGDVENTVNNTRLGSGVANSSGIPNFTLTGSTGGDTRYMLVQTSPSTKTLHLRDSLSTSTNLCSLSYTFTVSCTVSHFKTTSYGPGESVTASGNFEYRSPDGTSISPYVGNIDLRLFDFASGAEVVRDDAQTSAGGGFINNSGPSLPNTLAIPTVTPSNVGWWTLAASENVTSAGINPRLCTTPIYVSQISGETPPGPPPASGGGGATGTNPCASGNCETALGIIPTDATGFAGTVLRIAITIAGGIALIIMVRGAIKILMASGDPQKIQDGRDLMVAAIAGLLFLIFSVLILRFLGTDLLNLFN